MCSSCLVHRTDDESLTITTTQGTEEQSKSSKYDVQLYDDSECSFDDLLEMANDINKGDNALDFKV